MGAQGGQRHFQDHLALCHVHSGVLLRRFADSRGLWEPQLLPLSSQKAAEGTAQDLGPAGQRLELDEPRGLPGGERGVALPGPWRTRGFGELCVTPSRQSGRADVWGKGPGGRGKEGSGLDQETDANVGVLHLSCWGPVLQS